MSSCRALVPFKGLFVFVLLLTSAHAANPCTLGATIRRVSDGDTVVAVTENGTKLRTRLLSIDAPESPHGDKRAQPFGDEAWDYLDT